MCAHSSDCFEYGFAGGFAQLSKAIPDTARGGGGCRWGCRRGRFFPRGWFIDKFRWGVALERSAPVPAKDATMGNMQPSGSGQLIHARDIGVRPAKECEWLFNNSAPSIRLAQLRQRIRQNIGKLSGITPCLKSGVLAVLLMLAGSGSFLAEAHPHVWIDLRSTIVLDENGHVIGIEQEWLAGF